MYTDIIVSHNQKNHRVPGGRRLAANSAGGMGRPFPTLRGIVYHLLPSAPYHVKTSYRGGFVARTKRRQDGSPYNPPLYLNFRRFSDGF